MKRWVVRGALVVCGAIFGVLGAWLFFDNREAEYLAEQTNKYPYLSKQVFLDDPNDIFLDFVLMRDGLAEYLDAHEETNIQLYFEYLPNGTSFEMGAGNEVEMPGASLAKVPIAMDAYRMAELGELDLDQPVELIEDDLDDEYGTLYQEGVGYEITPREAARLMLVESDNTAFRLLIRLVESKAPSNYTSALVEVDSSFTFKASRYLPDKVDVLFSPRQYSKLLKCLYFACVINVGNSNDVLENLVMSNYDLRLTDPIPIQTPVAHKYGVHYDEVQSDCGIIYEENRNYVLCVMVEASQEQGSLIISEISEIVYRHVSRKQTTTD